jgi:hypothetical protein
VHVVKFDLELALGVYAQKQILVERAHHVIVDLEQLQGHVVFEHLVHFELRLNLLHKGVEERGQASVGWVFLTSKVLDYLKLADHVDKVIYGSDVQFSLPLKLTFVFQSLLCGLQQQVVVGLKENNGELLVKPALLHEHRPALVEAHAQLDLLERHLHLQSLSQQLLLPKQRGQVAVHLRTQLRDLLVLGMGSLNYKVAELRRNVCEGANRVNQESVLEVFSLAIENSLLLDALLYSLQDLLQRVVVQNVQTFFSQRRGLRQQRT